MCWLSQLVEIMGMVNVYLDMCLAMCLLKSCPYVSGCVLTVCVSVEIVGAHLWTCTTACPATDTGEIACCISYPKGIRKTTIEPCGFCGPYVLVFAVNTSVPSGLSNFDDRQKRFNLVLLLSNCLDSKASW